MPRAIWTGTIGFGLVNVPVRLYPATKRKDIRFHEIDRLSGRRIRHQKVVETPTPTLAPRGSENLEPPALIETARENLPLPLQSGTEPPIRMVPAPDVLKGFEISKDRYVTVGREELEELAPERSRTIDVQQFVDQDAIDPIYYDVSYYVVPERDHERAFGLLVETMAGTKKVAISWFMLRRKRYLAALRPYARLMILSTMFYADEVLPASDLEPSAAGGLRQKEREMAELLVNTLSGPFDPAHFPDEYRKKLAALIEGRAESARRAPAEAITSNGVQDLMAALQASVEQARAARKGPKPVNAAKTAKTAKRKRKTA